MVASVFNRFAPIDFTRYIDRLTERFTGREWLFEQIDRWLQQGNEQFYLLTGEPGVGKSAIAAKLTQLRNDIAAYHFCRAGDVETVRPGRVLRSLAAQLGRTLPHYGEALAKTIDPIHLRIEVNINIESLSNSQVTGIYIENLKESDPREELEILLRAPLALLTDLYAEHNEPLPILKLLLIDSLDEAVTTTGRDNIATLLAALSQAEGLPAWIRFILTSRRDLPVLQQFESLKLYKLEELLAQNLEDIERYVQSRVQELIVEPSEFQARLDQAQLSAERLVHEVKDLSKGNFLYTSLLVDGIATGELSLKNLSALPKTLNEVYQRFLRNRCPFRRWINRYQPILGTLTVTQEAISRELLVKFAGIDFQQIQDALGVLQQFLDEEDDEQGQKVYAIFHQSLREYLLDKKHNQDFWCDTKEQHDTIISCYEKESESWQELRQIDRYGLRYLAQHLVQVDRADELHMLLSLEKDGRNAWFDAKDGVAETAGFLIDVKLAWQQAEEEYEKDVSRHRAIALQYQYALMTASVNSLSDKVPLPLLPILLEKKVWTPEKALAYASNITDPEKQTETMRELAVCLPESYKEQAIQLAFKTATAIESGPDRAFNLIDLAPLLPAVLLPDALEAATAINNLNYRVHALVALAPYLTEALLPEAFKAACAIKDNCLRADALTALAPLFPGARAEALKSAIAISDNYSGAKALIALIPLMPGVGSQALEVACAIEQEHLRAYALADLAAYLPAAVPEALKAAIAADGDSCVKALQRLAPYLPSVPRLPEGLLAKTLSTVCAIEFDLYRADGLAALAPYLPESMLPNVLNAANALTEARYRAEVLTALAPRLPEVMAEALETVIAIEDRYDYYTSILKALVPHLPEALLQEALKAAIAIKDEQYRAQALTNLVPYLPTAISEALNATTAIKDESQRAHALAELTPCLSEVLLPEALKIATGIENESARAKALIALATRMPEVVTEALKASFVIRDEYYRIVALIALSSCVSDIIPIVLQATASIQNVFERAEVIAALAAMLPKALLPEALSAAYAITDESAIAKALVALALHFSEVLPEALSATCVIPSNYTSYKEVLAVLAPHLPEDLLKQALKVVCQDQHEYGRADALAVLAPYLPKTLLPEALIAACSIQNHSPRADALIALAPYLSEALWFEAFNSAIAITDNYSREKVQAAIASHIPDALLPKALDVACAIEEPIRVKVLTALVPCLPETLLPKALTAARSLDNSSHKANALTVIALRMPEVLREALNAATAIDYEYFRADAIKALAPHLPEALLSEALTSAFDIVDENSRVPLLIDLIPHLPNNLLSKVFKAACNSRLESVLTNLASRLPEALPEAYKAACAIADNYYRTQALTALVPMIPAALSEAFKAAIAIENQVSRANALTELVPHLPEPLLQEALSEALNAATAIEPGIEMSYSLRVQALEALVPYLPETLLIKALKAACAIQDIQDLTRILTALVPYFLKFPKQIYSFWNNSLHTLSSETRKELLQIIPEFLPVIETLGNKEAIKLITVVIQDVGHWWQ